MLIRFDKNILVIFAVLWKWSSMYNCHENFTSTNMHIEYVNYEAEIFFFLFDSQIAEKTITKYEYLK